MIRLLYYFSILGCVTAILINIYILIMGISEPWYGILFVFSIPFAVVTFLFWIFIRTTIKDKNDPQILTPNSSKEQIDTAKRKTWRRQKFKEMAITVGGISFVSITGNEGSLGFAASIVPLLIVVNLLLIYLFSQTAENKGLRIFANIIIWFIYALSIALMIFYYNQFI